MGQRILFILWSLLRILDVAQSVPNPKPQHNLRPTHPPSHNPSLGPGEVGDGDGPDDADEQKIEGDRLL